MSESTGNDDDDATHVTTYTDVPLSRWQKDDAGTLFIERSPAGAKVMATVHECLGAGGRVSVSTRFDDNYMSKIPGNAVERITARLEWKPKTIDQRTTTYKKRNPIIAPDY